MRSGWRWHADAHTDPARHASPDSDTNADASTNHGYRAPRPHSDADGHADAGHAGIGHD